MRRLRLGFLTTAALILPHLRADQTDSTPNIVVTYPSQVSSTPGQPATFNLSAIAPPGSTHNVWGNVTCTGPGLSITTSPQFQSLLIGPPTIITGTIAPSGPGTFPITCGGESGQRQGEDVQFTLNSFNDVQQAPQQATAPHLFEYANNIALGYDFLALGAIEGASTSGTVTVNITSALCGLAQLSDLQHIEQTLPLSVSTALLPIGYYFGVECISGAAGATYSLTSTTTNGTGNETSWISSSGPTFLAAPLLGMTDPVSTSTGELFAPATPTFLSLGGPLPLEFRRYYASLLNANQITTHTNNWTHNFESFLNILGPIANVVLYDGKRILFQQTAGGYTTVLPEQYDFQLVSGANNTYQFLDPRSNRIYTFAGTPSGTGVQVFSLTKIQDRNGNTLTVTPGPNGPTAVTDGHGRSLTFTYDANGNLIKVADQTGRSVSFAYTSATDGVYRDLLQITDANGKVWNYAYTKAGTYGGLMTSASLPLGNAPFTQTWGTLPQVATQTDSRGNVMTFSYDQPKGSSSYKDAAGDTGGYTSATWDAFLTFTDADGQTVTATYDGNQRRNSVTDRFGDKVSMTYDPASGKMATHTDETGNATSYTWTPQTSSPFTFHNLTQVKYADGTSISLAYDAFGNVTSMTDQAGKVTKFAYNSLGQLASETDPIGRVVTRAYNAADATLASITDAAGNVVKYSYDPLKRINLIAFADGSTRSYTYDNLDNIVKTTDERGKVTAFTFNDNDKLQTATDALSQKATVAYSTDEQVSKETDRTGQSTSYSYDPNDLLNKVTTPAGETFTFNHDNHRRLSALLDPAGNGLQYAYDKEDVIASITDALSRKLSFTTDHLGYSTQVTTPLGEKYSIARDSLERVTSTTDPSGIPTTTSYEPRGLVSAFAVGGLSSAFTFDDSGLLNGVTDPNGNPWSYTYDSAGRLGSRADPLNRSTQYSYDNRDRVSKIQTPLGPVAFTRDAAGNLLRRLYSDGTDLNYTYDGDNRLTGGPGVALSYDAEGRITASNGLTITRDADGRIASIAYAPGKTVQYAYNAVGLLASVTDWLNGVTTFTYDAAHELTAIKRANGLGTRYTYDLDGRIASITEDAGSSIAIQRDGAGKVVSETRTQPQLPMSAPGVLPLTYDAADQVSGFTYDSMGRVTTDTSRTYQWDLASRLTSYAGADGNASASYDGLGLRTSATSSGSTQSFVWNYATGLPSLATVKNSSGDQRYYVYRPDGTLLHAIDASNNARHFYHFDENGSTVLLTDDSGKVTDSYGITPYGETVTRAGSTANVFTWLGQFGVMQEGATGLYYMRARYYDSATSRFLSPDPIRSAHPMEVNPYQYARANPVRYLDPRGTDIESSEVVIPSAILGSWDQFDFDHRIALQRLAYIAEGLIRDEHLPEQILDSHEIPAPNDVQSIMGTLDAPDCGTPPPQKSGGQPADPTLINVFQPNLFPFPGDAGGHGPFAPDADSSDSEEEADAVPPPNPPAVCVVSLAPNGSQFLDTSLVSTPTMTVNIERIVLPPGARFYPYMVKGVPQDPTGFGFINPATGQGEYWSFSLIPIGKKPKIQIPPKAQKLYRFGYSVLNDSGVWEYVSTGPTGR